MSEMTKEQEDLHYENAVSKGAELSPSDFAASFALYMDGYSISRIVEMYPHLDIALLVKAHRDYKWEERRHNNMAALLDRIAQQALNVQSQALELSGSVLAATNAKFGGDLREFSKNPQDTALWEKVQGVVPQGVSDVKSILDSSARLTNVKGQPATVSAKEVVTAEKVTRTITAKGSSTMTGAAQKQLLQSLTPDK